MVVFRRKHKETIKEYCEAAEKFVQDNYQKELSDPLIVKDPVRPAEEHNVKYSLRNPLPDDYNTRLNKAMRSFNSTRDPKDVIAVLKVNPFVTFVDAIQAYIRAAGLRDSEVYKAAAIDRRLFSKMMGNRYYQPSKDTAVALAYALKLPYEDADMLLEKAGFTLSSSNRRDVILEYFFKNGIYNINDINEVLYTLGERIIGRL